MINGHAHNGAIKLTSIEAENISYGYVKLYRSITRKAWYKKSEYVHLFCHLILKASHSGFDTWFSGGSVTLQPGQLVTGRKKLSEETGINEHKADRILKTFELEQQIEQQTSNTSRLITILNWGIYQKPEQQITQQLHNDYTTTAQQLSTIQECFNNDNNVVKMIKIPFDHFWQLYDKKRGKEKCTKLWAALTDEERQTAINHISAYKISTPEVQFRKDPERYLKHKAFKDAIIIDGKHRSNNQLSAVAAGERKAF